MNFGSFSTYLYPFAGGVLYLVLTILANRVKRSNRKVREYRRLEATNVAAFQWIYEARSLAGMKGFTLPPLPKELTPEYLLGQAEADENTELDKVAQYVQALAIGQQTPSKDD